MKRNGKDTEYILRYLFALQSIAAYKADMMDYMTPYGLETRRQEAHDAMVEHVILPMLDADDKALVYVRTKDITDNLDKVWAIYDLTPFDLLDDDCISWLASYLEKLFSSTECKYFLEGKIQYIHGIHIPK